MNIGKHKPNRDIRAYRGMSGAYKNISEWATPHGESKHYKGKSTNRQKPKVRK